MNEQMTIIQLLAVVVPVVVSAIVAIATDKKVSLLKEELAGKSARIARLEQALIDHGIPLPDDPTVDRRTDGLNI